MGTQENRGPAGVSVREIATRAEAAIRRLDACDLCPRKCNVNRAGGGLGVCGIGRHARVASYAPHFGEESVLVGRTGSGTIFFGGCNLLCCFCQNHDIIHRAAGTETPPDRLAAIMLHLQNEGCCNINLVTPSHVVPQILEALAIAMPGGLNVPIVYNTSGYDSVETLRLLDGLIDIYMPDMKFHRDEGDEYLSGVTNYGETAEHAVREMHRQVGDLQVENGVATRGLLVRHLVMPSRLTSQPAWRQSQPRETANSAGIFRFLASLSPDTYVNIMDQYRPMYRARNHPRIGTMVTSEEYAAAVRQAREAGLRRIDG